MDQEEETITIQVAGVVVMGGPRGHHHGSNRGQRGGTVKQPQHTILCNKFPNCLYGNGRRFLHPGENGPPLS